MTEAKVPRLPNFTLTENEEKNRWELAHDETGK